MIYKTGSSLFHPMHRENANILSLLFKEDRNRYQLAKSKIEVKTSTFEKFKKGEFILQRNVKLSKCFDLMTCYSINIGIG